MDIFNLLNMIGGLSLFLYGMTIMGSGLSKMAGGKLESILERLTTKKIYAVLLGAGVTAIIQSSSATTVMVVGFVNSSIMNLKQAVGIIMGANIGTTITSWLLSLTSIKGSSILLKMLKPSSFSPILAAIGIIFILSQKEESKKKDLGSVLLGFTILMFEMETMSSSVSGLAQNETFTSLMTAFKNPVLGMLAGTIITAIIQSSSASVGILQALCSTGAVNYSVALPIIMGQNIGTCITSILSSIGANINAKRAAMVHLCFNVVGTVIFMLVFYSLNVFIDFSFLNLNASVFGIAIIHTSFNIGVTIVLYPFSNFLVRLTEILIKEKVERKDDEYAVSIDERFLDNPAFAMELCRNKAKEMANISFKSIKMAMNLLNDYDEEQYEDIIKYEELVDKYEDNLGSYLVRLSGKNINKEDSQSMSIILHSISDFERISDHAIEIANGIKHLFEDKLSFSSDAKEEVDTLCNAINDICELTEECFTNNNYELSKHVEPLEEVIDTLTKKIKENHISRLQNGKCTIEMGYILEDILNYLERVSDHCSNVAVEIITINDNEYNTHEYFKSLPANEREKFDKEYSDILKRYPIA